MSELYIITFLNGDNYKLKADNPEQALQKFLKEPDLYKIYTLDSSKDANTKVTCTLDNKVSYYNVVKDIFKNKDIPHGDRCSDHRELTDNEIENINDAIAKIEADPEVFKINYKGRVNTGYDPVDDIVNIGVDVIPDIKYGSAHPRDLMSIRAVLAHEYYGHRPYRNEYLQDLENGSKSTSYCDDEFRADYEAAKYGKGLTNLDRCQLIQSAIFRKVEKGHVIENDDFMKEVLYGYRSDEQR